MSALCLHNVSKSYRAAGGTPRPVLDKVSLEVAEGEFVAIVGYSGTGKTTLINLLAGLVRPDAGSVTHNGQAVRGPSPSRAVVFQNYSLLPWLSVAGNIELAVKASHRRASLAECRDKVAAAVALVRLSHAAERLPRQLSGGMRQRVSLARGLAMDPAVLLLDEPLSALDALTRGSLQEEIARIWQESRKTVVLITNDVDEAILLADRVIPIMGAGPATLGEPVVINLPRPRDRKALNHDAEFQRIRRVVLEALMGQRREQSAARHAIPSRIARPPENVSHLSTLNRWMLRGEARAQRKGKQPSKQTTHA